MTPTPIAATDANAMAALRYRCAKKGNAFTSSCLKKRMAAVERARRTVRPSGLHPLLPDDGFMRPFAEHGRSDHSKGSLEEDLVEGS
jgi:hypothetical protein